jgi:uncharacterized protein (UPF0333 family)
MKRGQVALEVLVFSGLFLLALGVVLVYASHVSSQDIAYHQADDAVRGIVAAADAAYTLGPGSVQYATVTIPGGSPTLTVQGRSVNLRLHLNGKVTDFPGRSLANLTGSLQSSRGTYRIKATALDSGVVELAG